MEFTKSDPQNEDQKFDSSFSSENSDNFDSKNPFKLADKIGEPEILIPKDSIVKKILEIGHGLSKPENYDFVTISYEAFFIDKTNIRVLFDKNEKCEFYLNDPSKIPGLKTCISSMRKEEKSEFVIKPKYAYKKCSENVKIPCKFDKKSTVVFIIKLLDFKKVQNINNDENENMLKIIDKKGKSYKTPNNDSDEICVSYEILQKTNENTEISLIKIENKISKINENSIILQNLFKTMKISEICTCIVKSAYFSTQDPEISKIHNLDLSKNIKIIAELNNFIEIEDFYKDKQIYKKLWRHGKLSTNSTIEGSVEFQMKIIADNKILFSNFEIKPLISKKKQIFWKFDEKNIKFPENCPEILKYKLNEYKLPPLFTKILKEMFCEEIIELNISLKNDIIKSKLVPYFNNDPIFTKKLFFNTETNKDYENMIIFIYMRNTEKSLPFAELNFKNKSEKILQLKEIASNLFKMGYIKKAAKLYQKINAWLSFGDYENIGPEEKKENLEMEFEKIKNVKKVCLLNTAVCKFKLNDYKMVISCVNEVLKNDENNIKALYWKSKALFLLKEYDSSYKIIKKALQLEPNNPDILHEFNEIKENYEKSLANEKKIYTKLFK